MAYVALEWVSFIHEYKSVPITPWNPGLGVVFALMLLGGARYSTVLFAGVVIAETTVLRTALPWPIILGIAGIFALVYGAAAFVARERLRLDPSLFHLRDVVVLLACGISGAILVAVLLSVLMLLHGQLERPDVFVAAVPLLLGDIIGIAVMTPLLLRLICNGREALMGHSRVVVPEILLYAAMIAASLWIIAGAGTNTGFKFFYLLFVAGRRLRGAPWFRRRLHRARRHPVRPGRRPAFVRH